MYTQWQDLTIQAVPAMLIGIALGPVAAKFIDSEEWGSARSGQTVYITTVCL